MPPLSLTEAYRRHLDEHGFESDAAQRALVARLQGLSDALARPAESGRAGRRRLRGRPEDGSPRGMPQNTPRGIYVWGEVGRGKTFLFDLFFRNLGLERKLRVHFHEFMREVHALLAATRNVRNPLEKVAHRFADRARLLYLDEFQVSDIGDAMILAELLQCLSKRGVVLAITSNCAPRALYRDGLQRQRFLPAIALIEERLDVVELAAPCDYRLRAARGLHLYNAPADEAAARAMEENFHRIASAPAESGVPLKINGREIPTRRRAGGVAWFDFDALCGGPRSPSDYLEIARCCETVLVSDVPLFDDQDDLARRFIHLIDAFYDRRVRLIASAADAPGRLYRGGRLAREFERTASRLIEMQSPDYLAGTPR